MDHAYVRTTPETPWRTAAIVAAGVAAVELFILIVLGVVLGAKLVSNHTEAAVTPVTKAAAKTPATTPAATTEGKKPTATRTSARPALPRQRTSVIVLNGNGIPGAAAVTADRLRRFHYIVAATGNAPRTFSRSLIMYRPRYEAEAKRLGHDLHVRRVVPLDGVTRRDLQGAHIAVIIGG
ncbi:MAG TPA: LytR C-terminal domain-containing protein [Gaiellaceae bacterium]